MSHISPKDHEVVEFHEAREILRGVVGLPKDPRVDAVDLGVDLERKVTEVLRPPLAEVLSPDTSLGGTKTLAGDTNDSVGEELDVL